jgi:hypothetical protein
MAVPTVMLAMIAAFGLAGGAVVASVNSQNGTARDQSSKSALAAAEAGANEALLHYNRIPTTGPNTCLTGNPIVATVPSGGWCTPVTKTMSGVTNGSYTYWVRPTANQLQIISQGNVGGVTRRTQVVARSSAGLQPFSGNMGVIGLDWINLNSNALITANAGTNGDITMDSNSHITCSYSQVGVGRNVLMNSNASYSCAPAGHGAISLPPVNQGDVATNNSNGRICNLDPLSGASCNSATWNPSTRQLTLNSNATLTLGGTNYSFCKIILNSNTSIIVAAGQTVRLYFDSPEACGLSSGTAQLAMNSNSRISTTGATPIELALLFVGSDTRATSAILNSNTQANQACEQDWVFYAPRTALTMNSNSFYCGAMAAKSIMLNSNSDIQVSNAAAGFQLPNTVAHHYEPEQFVECFPTQPGGAPDSGC